MDNLSMLISKVLPFLGMVGKEVAKKQTVDIGNKLVSKALRKSKNSLNNKSEMILNKYLQPSLSSMIDGSGSGVVGIPIQNLVRKLIP